MADWTKLLGALARLAKETPLENVPSGKLDKPIPEEGALIGLEDLVNLGALRDLPIRPPGKPPLSVAPRMGRPSDKFSHIRSVTKTNDPVLNDFLTDFKFLGTADNVKDIVLSNQMKDDWWLDDWYGDIKRNKDGQLEGFLRQHWEDMQLTGRLPEDYLHPINKRVIPNTDTITQYFYESAQDALQNFPEEMYVFRQGDVLDSDNIFSFSLDPNPKGNIYSADAPVETYKVKKSDILAMPNLHKHPDAAFAHEEEILIPGDKVEFTDSGFKLERR
jgi:hypothetical protein